MKNVSLIMLIMEAVCGVVCIGFGIAYFVQEKVANGAVFAIVGVICLITAVRTFLIMRKNNKNDGDDDGKK